MDSLNKMMKSVRSMNFGKLESDANLEYASYAVFGLSVLYILYCGQLATIGLALGVALILYVVTGGNKAIPLFAGAITGLIAVYYSRRRAEGFTDEQKEEKEAEDETEENEEVEEKEKKAEAPSAEKKESFETMEDGEEEDEEDVTEGFMGYNAGPSYGNFNGEPESLEGFANPKPRRRRAAKKAPPPDNGSRAEMFELGKKYKLPSEGDDADFHLDAGTTFMNAYKSLKPDQIAAMTKDTQELMETQKQLMSTLSTLKPLIQDGKEMMNMFQGYFGTGKASTN